MECYAALRDHLSELKSLHVEGSAKLRGENAKTGSVRAHAMTKFHTLLFIQPVRPRFSSAHPRHASPLPD